MSRAGGGRMSGLPAARSKIFDADRPLSLEKIGCAEEADLDFPSPRLGFSFRRLGFSFQRLGLPFRRLARAHRELWKETPPGSGILTPPIDHDEAVAYYGAPPLVHQRAPRRIAGIAGRRHEEFGVAENIGHVDLGTARTAGVAEEHDVETVGREGRTLVVEAFDEDPLAGAVRLHHADAEGFALDAGEGDEVAARRPDRRRIAAFAEGDALGRAAARAHHVDLLRAAAIGFEGDLRAVGRIG